MLHNSLVFVQGSWEVPSKSLEFPNWQGCLGYSPWAPGAIPEFMLRDHSKWGLIAPERATMCFQPCDVSLTSGERRGLETEFNPVDSDSASRAHIMKPQWKLQTLQLRWTPWLLIHINVPGGECVLRTQKLWVWFPSKTVPVCLFTWLVLICILHNKTVTVIQCLPEFSELF